MRTYASFQQRHNGISTPGGHGAASGDGEIATEIATQTDMSELSKNLLERDEQSLEHLAEADLAYLEMVRTKAGMSHHHTAGALATSEAEQALADSWQQLIMLRLKSQKLQLRQQAQGMSTADMARVEQELMLETTRIASKLQQELQHSQGERNAAAAHGRVATHSK